jgi:hypothetical protein
VSATCNERTHIGNRSKRKTKINSADTKENKIAIEEPTTMYFHLMTPGVETTRTAADFCLLCRISATLLGEGRRGSEVWVIFKPAPNAICFILLSPSLASNAKGLALADAGGLCSTGLLFALPAPAEYDLAYPGPQSLPE